jgi:HlyD family secretion protein
MTSNNNTNNTGAAARRPYKIAGVALLVVAIVICVIWLKAVRGGDDPTMSMPTFVALRGPLTISVLESGAIKAKEQEVIRNEVEGRTSIISIIPEGTAVKKGDVLVELDVSTLKDTRIDQEIRMNNAEAFFINAQETLKITESQGQSDVDKAELALRFAQQDMKVYLEGKYLNDKTAFENKVAEANEVLIRGQEVLKWSQTLYNEKYISETELKADKLAVTKNQNSLVVARNDLRLLEEFTKQRQIDQLESDVKQAKMALERAIAKKNANDVQAKADLEAKDQEYKRQVSKLEKIDLQLSRATLTSPADGMVVYATSSRGGFGRDDRRPLAEGVEVFERQELIYIPKSASSVAEVDVHEASLEKVRPGLPAIVRVDALPGKVFVGSVARIAPLPNAQSMWMNPDLKIYTTNINLESIDPGLRSGMSCKADIIVEQYQDVVYVPIQAVIRVAGQPTLYVVQDGQIEDRKVEIGLDDNTYVVVSKGLNEGEVVLMTPPLNEAALEPGSKMAGVDANDPMAMRISEKLKAVNGIEAGSPPAGVTGPQTGPQTERPGEARQGGQGFQMPSAEQMRQFQNMTPEEREKAMQERLKNMTPEERDQAQKMRDRFQNMTPEEREQMRQQRRGGQDRGDGTGPGSGGRRGGAGPGGRGDGAGPGSGGRSDGAGAGSQQPGGGR